MPEDESSRSWDTLRSALAELAISRGEYGGYPLPDDSNRLVMEPRFPVASLNGFRFGDGGQASEEMVSRAGELFDFSNEQIFLISVWHSEVAGGDVYVYHTGDGMAKCTVIPARHDEKQAEMMLNTLGSSRNWSVKAEEMALEKLMNLVKPHQYRDYVMTGYFIERSPRSQVLYIFQRCKPTIALRHRSDGTMTVLAHLCGHPIGYYESSYAGAMVPTDDVISHLLLMRGDEVYYWRKCNQHMRRGG